MAKLIVREGEKAGQEIELRERRLILGSSPDSQIVLTDPGIEKGHASLEDRSGRWILQDLGGPGGTLVNGVAVDGPYRLSDGDIIELAGVKLEIRGIGPPARRAAPTRPLPDVSDAPPPTHAPSVVIPAPTDQTPGRTGFPFLAIVGGGILAVVAVAAVTIGLASGVWWYQSSAALRPSAETAPGPSTATILPDVETAPPLVEEQPTPVLILLQPRSQEVIIGPGEELIIRSRTKDAAGVERVELWVDGALVITTLAEAEATTDFVAEQAWSSDELGSYRLDILAYNQIDLPSNVGSFLVTIVPPTVAVTATSTEPPPSGPTARPTPSPTGLPPTPLQSVTPSPPATGEPTPLPPTPGATEPGGEQPFINFFHCTPACVVDQGSSLLLEWDVQGATQVYLDGAEVELTGSLLITPTAAITYELWALNATEEVSRTLPIGVR